MIDALYAPDWKAWFGQGGGKYAGTPKDPRIVLIEVVPESVTYMKSNRPAVVALFEIAKGMVTGEAPKFGDLRELSGREIEEGRASKPAARKAKARSSTRSGKKSAKKPAGKKAKR